MASDVSICNQALSWLGGNLIISLDDNTTEAKICKANYVPLRDAVTEEGKWTWATQRYKLLPNPQTPVYGYGQRFEIPSDVLTVVQVTQFEENANDSDDFNFRVEGNFIMSNVDVIYMKGIRRIVDVSQFTTTFIQALAARIAADIAGVITESTTKEGQMLVKYERLMKTALAIDGLQGASDRIRTKSQIVRRR